MRISYSGLETFSSCPAKYKYQYIDRIKTPKSKEAVFGTLIHECLKTFHNPSQTAPLSEDNLLKYFTDKWNSDIYTDKQEEAFAFHQGIEMLKNYFAQNQNANFDVIGLETPFSALVNAENEIHQITGRIDRIDKLSDGSFEIIDYKTSKRMPPQDEVDNNRQLFTYYLGLVHRWPVLQAENRPIKLSLYYLRHGEKLSTIQTAERIDKVKQDVMQIISQIQQSNFEPKSNPLCDWCQYQPHCPLFRHKFINNAKQTINDQQIKNIIKEYFEIKNQQSQDAKKIAELKKLINQYCDENKLERVFGDEGYITRLPQQRFAYDLVKVKEILEPLNKWDEILTVDNTKLKKVVATLPLHLQKEIENSKEVVKEFKVLTTGAMKK